MKYFSDIESRRDVAYAATSFGITASRLVLAGYVGLQLINNANGARAFGAIAICMLMVFDYLDGAFFRRSRLSDVKAFRVNRRLFDSVADRLTIQMCCIPLLIVDRSFSVFYIIITIRELLISGYLTKLYRKGFLLYPGPVAKTACVSIGLVVISFLTRFSSATVILSLAMIVLSALSAKEYLNTLKDYRGNRLIQHGTRLEIIGAKCRQDP
jgi:phosphatidylglycerophosphate synthase